VTVPILQVIREVQIPLVAVILLAASVTKLRRTLRTGSVDSSLGPTALFPVSLRRPVAIFICVVELGLGLGLIATAAGNVLAGSDALAASNAAYFVVPATLVRLGAGLLFLIATSALIELRTVRPDVGCGCFGPWPSSRPLTFARSRRRTPPVPAWSCWRSSAPSCC
jgi:hypothetical protein